MNKQELIQKLNAIEGKKKTERFYDTENGHGEADELLLEFISDPEIEEAYNNVEKWYA